MPPPGAAQARSFDMNDKPTGRDSVRSALIEAAADLFAERGPSRVSVREIATRAGVNHGLVHRHFGSKDGLLKAVMSALADDVHDRVGQPDARESLADILRGTFTGTRDGGRHWRILVRALLDGAEPTELQSEFPVFDRLVAASERGGDEDPTAKAVHVFAVGLGLMVFDRYLQAASGREGEVWRATLLRVMGSLAE